MCTIPASILLDYLSNKPYTSVLAIILFYTSLILYEFGFGKEKSYPMDDKNSKSNIKQKFQLDLW